MTVSPASQFSLGGVIVSWNLECEKGEGELRWPLRVLLAVALSVAISVRLCTGARASRAGVRHRVLA